MATLTLMDASAMNTGRKNSNGSPPRIGSHGETDPAKVGK